MSDCQPWHFDEALDTLKSFRGFNIYLNLGLRGSVDAAYCEYIGTETGSKRAAGFFKNWSQKGRWVSRKQAYFRHIQEQVAEQSRIEAIAKRKSDLESFRRSAEVFPKRILKLTDKALNAIESGDINAAKSQLSALRMAGQVLGDSPHGLWAKALQVDAIQKQLDGLNASDESEANEPRFGNCQNCQH